MSFQVVKGYTTPEGRQAWNDFIKSSPYGHLMQLCEWGDFKLAQGWKVHRIGLEQNQELLAGLQILVQRPSFLPASIAYVPKGPVVDLQRPDLLEPLLAEMHQVAKMEKTIFLKIEPSFMDDPTSHQVLEHQGFQASSHTNQPRSTILVDLSPGEDALLASFRKKTRKLVRRAGREGVLIVEGGTQDLSDFYGVLNATSDIKDFSIHDQTFYEQAWQAFSPSQPVKLFLAKHQDEVVAGKMIFIFKDRCLHFWGGTSPKGRDIFASYLIQWASLQWAMSQGCRYTDLWGIPDEIGDMLRRGEEIPKDRQGALWGVYNFKRGFGDVIEAYVGAYDYVYNKALYALSMKALDSVYASDAIPRLLKRLRA